MSLQSEGRNMRVTSSVIISLVLTATISFALPVAIAGMVFGIAFVLSLLPGLEAIGQETISYIFSFLAVFGNGKAIGGLVTLGLVSSFVGVMLDLSNAYRYQSMR